METSKVSLIIKYNYFEYVLFYDSQGTTCPAIKKNTSRNLFLRRFLCKQQLLSNNFLESYGVVDGMNELVSDDIFNYLNSSL